MNILNDLINAYRFAFMDLSKEFPMPFEHYKWDGKSDNVKSVLFQDRKIFYIARKPSDEHTSRLKKSLQRNKKESNS